MHYWNIRLKVRDEKVAAENQCRASDVGGDSFFCEQLTFSQKVSYFLALCLDWIELCKPEAAGLTWRTMITA